MKGFIGFKFWIWLISTLTIILGSLPLTGQTPLFKETVPLIGGSTSILNPEKTFNWYLKTGDSALQFGFPGLAEDFYKQGLDALNLDFSQKQILLLRYSASLIAQFDFSRAETVLSLVETTDDNDYFIQKALIALYLKSFEDAQLSLSKISVEQLSIHQQPWYYLAWGLTHTGKGNQAEAEAFFKKGLQVSNSSAAKEWFETALAYSQILLQSVSVETLEYLRKEALIKSKTVKKYDNERTYAIALFQVGQKKEAITLLEHQLKYLPLEFKNERAQALLLYAVLIGSQSIKGEQALKEVLIKSADKEFQQQALYLLSTILSRADVNVQEAFFNIFLKPSGESHPLLDEILLLKAYLLLAQGQIQEAEVILQSLLQQFPASGIKDTVLKLLAYSATRQQPAQYRTAANYLNQLLISKNSVYERIEVNVLIGDCYFLNEDYIQAADIYSSILKELQMIPVFDQAAVIYQCVLSQIRSHFLEAALQTIETAVKEGSLTGAYRWMCEWNWLINARAEGFIQEVNERLSSQLTSPALKNEPYLYLRFLWLDAYLKFEIKEYNLIPDQMNEVLKALQESPIAQKEDAALMASQSLLLKAKALLAMDDSASATIIFDLLRQDYIDSEAAMLSYLEEGRYYASQHRLVDAQQKFTELADLYPESKYAPIGLYEAAISATLRGQAASLEQGFALLERLNAEYSGHDLIFYARFKQADILRSLNKFLSAHWIYENLLYLFPKHPDRYVVELARARCLLFINAQDSNYMKEGLTALENLFDSPAVSTNVRIEAGHTLGYFLEQSNNYSQAKVVYWVVLQRFLIDEPLSCSLNSSCCYWLTRTALQLAARLEAEKDIKEAQKVYHLILEYDLPGQGIAQSKINIL
jgi:hypothetical protein